MTFTTLRAALAALALLSLSGCIDSSGPIMPDSQPVFGPKLRVQTFTLRKGYAYDAAPANFDWNGHLYAHSGGKSLGVSAFSVHPFEAGDYIVQTVPERRARISEYGLMHRIAEGVYVVWAIDEMDADEATRTAYCRKGEKNDPSPCRIETRDQLFAFARATAARNKEDGGLVIRLPDGSQKQERPARRR